MNLFRKSCKLLKPYCIWVNEVTFCLISNFSPLPLWAWALHVHMQSVDQQANFLKIAYRSFLGLPKQTTTNGWLDTGGIYSLTVPEATSPKLRYWQGWFLLWARDESAPGLSLRFCVGSPCVLLSWQTHHSKRCLRHHVAHGVCSLPCCLPSGGVSVSPLLSL